MSQIGSRYIYISHTKEERMNDTENYLLHL